MPHMYHYNTMYCVIYLAAAADVRPLASSDGIHRNVNSSEVLSSVYSGQIIQLVYWTVRD